VAAEEITAADRFCAVVSLVEGQLAEHLDHDWSRRAGTLDWSCRQTVDHLVDCLVSYALQVASRSQGPFLPFQEFHALPEATNRHLVSALWGIGELFANALRVTPPGPCAGDGLVQLDAEGWAQRGSYELLVHTHDIMTGFGERFSPPAELASWVLASEGLWMLDRKRAAHSGSAWSAVVLGSGREDA
jgi:hypothetical protein